MAPRINKPGQGRKRVYPTELPVYDSMTEAGAATGIPLAAFGHAKKNGCLFVRHGRVHLSEFVRWWFNQSVEEEGEGKVDWAKRDKRATALLREVKLSEEEKRVIDFDKVERFVRHLVGVAFFGELDRMAQEYPGQLKGRTEVEISSECLAQNETIKGEIKRQLELFVENNKSK